MKHTIARRQWVLPMWTYGSWRQKINSVIFAYICCATGHLLLYGFVTLARRWNPCQQASIGSISSVVTGGELIGPCAPSGWPITCSAPDWITLPSRAEPNTYLAGLCPPFSDGGSSAGVILERCLRRPF